MDRLTNDETYSILKTHIEGIPSWADIVNQKEKIYVALAEYEKTGLKPEEIEKLKQENAVLESKLNKAITLLQSIKEYIPHQCSTCAHWVWVDDIKMRCNAGGCLNLNKPDRWEWIYKAELQELIGGSENEL